MNGFFDQYPECLTMTRSQIKNWLAAQDETNFGRPIATMQDDIKKLDNRIAFSVEWRQTGRKQAEEHLHLLSMLSKLMK